ncbi:MAG: outer membrane protein assembly factor BamD [bacterium]|jgi:outer membrane protein assembly factor BamD
MIQRIVLISALLSLCLACCSGSRSRVEVEPTDRLAQADGLAERGDCRKAILKYEELLAEFPPPEIAERARFNRTRCRVELEDYDLAINEFEDYIDSYPQGDLVDDAMYMIGIAYLRQSPRAERDQTYTEKAASELEFMLREYPESNVRQEAEAALAEARAKLARKEYLNGKLYLNMEYFRAARICFDLVINEYSDTEWAAWSLLGKAQTYDREGNTGKALELYNKVLDDYPDTEPYGRAGMRIDQISSGDENDEEE